MASWIQPITKVAARTASKRGSLRDEEYLEQLMAQAGVQDKKSKATFLETLSSALGAFEWSDDALKAHKEGSGVGGAVGSYLIDVPRTLAGVALGKRDWIDPDEGHGVELMKELGVSSKVAQYGLGTLADIVEPSMAVSGVAKGGQKVLTATGDDFVKQLAKVSANNIDDGIKLLVGEFGDDVAESVSKRVLKHGDDILDVAADYIVKKGAKRGLTKTLEQGFYLGSSAEKGIPIAKGAIPGYIARLVDSPIVAPFEIGGDVLTKTGLKSSKTGLKISKGLHRGLLKNFDFQHALKRTGDPVLKKFGEQAHGINAASEYAGAQKAKTIEEFFKRMPAKYKDEFVNKSIGNYIEAATGLPQNTTMEQFVKFLGNPDVALIDTEGAKKILKNMDKGFKNVTFEQARSLLRGQKLADFEQLGLGTDGAAELLRRNLGEAYNFFGKRVKNIDQRSVPWEKLLKDIHYKGDGILRSVEDVVQFEERLALSDLDDYTKEFYMRYVAEPIKDNIEIAARREALGLGDMGAGYWNRTFNIDNLKELPDKVKKNLLDTKERTIPTLADLDLFNEFSGKHLELDTGASALVKQISFKEGQDYAVKEVHNLYNTLIEQVEQGLMDGFGIQGIDDIPKTWRKTGVPMLDARGIRVDRDIWEIVEDTNKFLVGNIEFNPILKSVGKFNTYWRGMTTAMTLNIKGKELPLNPAYYVRNFINNKMSNILYGGMNPTDIPVRGYQAEKVWKYLQEGVGGDELIGDYKVSDIARRFVKQGGLGGTNIDDIRKSIEDVPRIFGSGEFSNHLENNDKIALFIDQKLKHVADTAAMNKVRYSLFDYSQLTDFEINKVKPLFAFYTWNKKNAVSFFSTLAKDPKRVKVFDDMFKGLKQLADDTDTDLKEILPDYLQEAYAVVLGGGDEAGVMYGFGTNVEAVGDLIGRDWRESSQSMLSAFSPATRMLFEVITDYNYFKQKPISEDKTAYSYRNLPDGMKKLLGIESNTFTDKESGKEITTYKMDPSVKYAIEQMRPVSSLLKSFDIVTDEGVNNEMFLDLLRYLSGVKYQQYDTEYLRRQLKNERYKERMELLMDEGIVNEYINYYEPKDKD